MPLPLFFRPQAGVSVAGTVVTGFSTWAPQIRQAPVEKSRWCTALTMHPVAAAYPVFSIQVL